MTKIGFSTGDFYKSETGLLERVDVIRSLGCRALEINLLRLGEFFGKDLEKLTAGNLKDFDFISLHAPKCDYGDNEETLKIFEKISKINTIKRLDAVVFHPDMVSDFAIFDRAGFAVSFENMDNRKKRYQTPDELAPIFAKNSNFKLTLDLNHIFSNDPSMALADEFYEKLGSKTSHIHLSGYAGYHEPLFQTKQLEIIRAVKNPEIPIVIESTILPEDAKREYDYILDNLKI